MKVSTIGTVGLALTILQGFTCIGAQSSASQTPTSSLEMLTGKAGWITLGDVTLDLENWVSGGDPTAGFKMGPYEIVGKNVDRRKPILPKVGDRIRLTARNEVLILDYATTGEKRALESPSSVTRSKGPGDRTGIVLEPGTVVEVQAVEISGPIGQGRIVWARVSAVTN